MMAIPVTDPPSEEWLEEATQINRIFNHAIDWKSALNQAVPLIRKMVIFDNLVIYQYEKTGNNLLVEYARATGRGRSRGAEISWGEPFAQKVLSAKTPLIEQAFIDKADRDRLDKPILLGIPLEIEQDTIAVFILIRFGSPLFDDQQLKIAMWISQQIHALLFRKDVLHKLDTIEEEHRQFQFQDDFLSAISHELRTPLGYIKGYTTTLLRNDTVWDNNTHQEFLTIIDQETDRLQELIDNLLDSSRLQSHTMSINFQRIRIEPLIRDVKNRFETQHPGLEINLQLADDLPALEADPARLSQVLGNLVINAIKYAPGKPINVQTRRRTAGLTIIVKDFGQGIPADDLPHIFDRFYRGENAQTEHGSGLGLFICRQIIRSHHGKISVDSKMGTGTRFIIHLPYHQQKSSEDL